MTLHETEAQLIDRLAREAQEIAETGVPLAVVADALMTVGLRFEVAAHGARAVTGRLATATMAMKQLADQVDAQPAGSNASN